MFSRIANRENRYSIHVLAAMQFFSGKCVVAGAVVGRTLATRLNAEIENELIDGTPIAFFTDLEATVEWILNKVLEATKQSPTRVSA